MADEGGDKTEEPTQKKLDDARKRGQVWKSRDLSGALVFFTGYAVMARSVEAVYTRFNDLFREAVDKVTHPGVPWEDASAALTSGITAVIILSLPVVAGAAVVGALSDFLQVGPLFTGDPVMPKLEKLNPIDGLKNIFSKKAVVDGLKNTAEPHLAGGAHRPLHAQPDRGGGG
jgi:flagellar biosynthetic protein FlhB